MGLVPLLEEEGRDLSQGEYTEERLWKHTWGRQSITRSAMVLILDFPPQK
jgi:hypothetical protein